MDLLADEIILGFHRMRRRRFPATIHRPRGSRRAKRGALSFPDSVELMQAGFSADEVDWLLQMLEAGQALFAGEQPVLCHGDFLPGHLFVDDDLHLCGVIDFGEFHGGGRSSISPT